MVKSLNTLIDKVENKYSFYLRFYELLKQKSFKIVAGWYSTDEAETKCSLVLRNFYYMSLKLSLNHLITFALNDIIVFFENLSDSFVGGHNREIKLTDDTSEKMNVYDPLPKVQEVAILVFHFYRQKLTDSDLKVILIFAE